MHKDIIVVFLFYLKNIYIENAEINSLYLLDFCFVKKHVDKIVKVS